LTTASKDRRQINRATIGEGTIIIRSDPNAGLEGLNRDLARA
jgi:filamentous hemagglutinin